MLLILILILILFLLLLLASFAVVVDAFVGFLLWSVVFVLRARRRRSRVVIDIMHRGERRSSRSS